MDTRITYNIYLQGYGDMYDAYIYPTGKTMFTQMEFPKQKQSD